MSTRRRAPKPVSKKEPYSIKDIYTGMRWYPHPHSQIANFATALTDIVEDTTGLAMLNTFLYIIDKVRI